MCLYLETGPKEVIKVNVVIRVGPSTPGLLSLYEEIWTQVQGRGRGRGHMTTQGEGGRTHRSTGEAEQKPTLLTPGSPISKTVRENPCVVSASRSW